MFVDPCIIVQFINKIQQDATMYQNFIIPYLYEAQRVSGDTPPIIRSLKLHWQPLVLHTWKVVGRVVAVPCQEHTRTASDNVHQLHVQTTFHVRKTRGCQCSFRLLMMGRVSPETCWSSYKYGIKKVLIHCYLVGFLFMNWVLLKLGVSINRWLSKPIFVSPILV